MKHLSFLILCLLSVSLLSCEDDEKVRQTEILRAQKYNDSILNIIRSNWKLNVPAPSPKVQQYVNNWNEWQQFKNELLQKPTGKIDAYRQKTKNLAEKAGLLVNNIPPVFDKPQVRSRIGVLITKLRSMYTYINLEIAQDKKIIGLIPEVNHETAAIFAQFDEIIRLSEIPREIGEDEMLRALDTTRMANPDAPQPAPDLQQPQRLPPGPRTNNMITPRRRMQPITPVN